MEAIAGTEPGPDPAHRAAVTLTYVPAEPALQPLLTTLYELRVDAAESEDFLPAMTGQLMIVLEGAAEIAFHEQPFAPLPPAALVGQTAAAFRVRIAGPFRAIGAALSPLGWAELTRLDARRTADSTVAAEQVLGPSIAALASDLRGANQAAAADLAGQLAGFVAAHRFPLNPDHAAVIAATADWLSSALDPSLSALYARTAYSPRQLQRLIERYFGASPRALVRKYRVLRVAALLQDPDLAPERLAELLNLFYDQSHLIREMRLFLGRTPGRLGDGTDLLHEAASGIANYRKFRPNLARIPGD